MLTLPEGTDFGKLKEEVLKLKWFHSFPIGGDLVTPGVDPTLSKLHALQLPENLLGMSVLDIGAYNGFFSFECESRGARVTANDHFVWDFPGSDAKKCFDLLHEAYQSQAEVWNCPVEALHLTGTRKPFDIVLFLGVLYHTTDPFYYLAKAAGMTKHLLIVETLIDCCDVNRPAMAYYPLGSMNNDATTHWGPNTLAVMEMLKDVGFSQIECFPPWDINTMANTQTGYGYPIPVNGSGRQVIHAYR